jgi:hypothetical protein
MRVLNDYIRYLSALKDSPKAVSMMKTGNVSFGKADLAAIVLASVPMTWQNQYNLTHLTVPESTRALLPDLEAIKWVMVEKQNKRHNAKGRLLQPGLKPRVIPRGRQLRGLTGQVPKKGYSEKFCQCCKAHGGPYQTHNTLDCCCYNSNGKPLKAAAGKPAESKKSHKKFGGNKSMAFMQTMFKAYVKVQKAGKSKKCKKRDYDSSDSVCVCLSSGYRGGYC